MRTVELMLAYGAVGIACAVTLVFVARGRWGDAALLAVFWPLYGPFLILGSMTPRTDNAFMQRLLPDKVTVEKLNERLHLAQGKVEEIDRLLKREEFSRVEVEKRHKTLVASGDQRAAASANARLENIGRLQRLRERFSRELTELDELLAQLRVQAEVVRLAGSADEETRELVSEIVCRVEGLDLILAEDTR